MTTSAVETLRWYKKMLDAGNKKPGLLHGIAHTLGIIIEYMKYNCWHDIIKNPSDLPKNGDGQVIAAFDREDGAMIYVLCDAADVTAQSEDLKEGRRMVAWRFFDEYK